MMGLHGRHAGDKEFKAMKRNLFISFLLFVAGIAINAQSIDRYVIASAGSSATLGVEYIDWTIGESVIETLNNNDLILSQGFHQYPLLVRPLYAIDGNIFADGTLYSDAEVFLYVADLDNSLPAIQKCNSPGGAFSFVFIPEDNYVIYAVPQDLSNYLPSYYFSTVFRNHAYVMHADANIGGIDLHLVSRFDGLEENMPENESDIKVFPNPFTEFIHIYLGKEIKSPVKVKICDLAGNAVLTNTLTANDMNQIDLTDIPNGTYILVVEGDNEIYTRLVSKLELNCIEN